MTEDLARAAVPEHYQVNLGELADLTGYSETTLRKWIRQHEDFPVLNRGDHGVAYEFDVRAVKAWIDKHHAEAQASKDANGERLAQIKLELWGDHDLGQDEESRKLSPKEESEMIQARLAALKLAREHGQILIKTDVERTMAQAFGALRDEVLGLSDLLRTELSLSRSDCTRIEGQLEKFLRRLAQRLGREDFYRSQDEAA